MCPPHRLRLHDTRRAAPSAPSRPTASAPAPRHPHCRRWRRSHFSAPWALPGVPEADALAAFLAGSALGDDELGYRLLLAAPFPVEVARRYGFLAAGGVGLLLGAVRAQDVRPLCESWAVWADIRRLCGGIIAAARGRPPQRPSRDGGTFGPPPSSCSSSSSFPFSACSLRRLPRDFSISHPTQAYL